MPGDKALWERLIGALYWAKHHPDTLAELDAYDAKYPDNDFSSGMRDGIDRREGRLTVAITRAQTRFAAHQASRGQLNNVAWDALFVPGDLLRSALPLAQAACDPETAASSGSLHTLATVYAELGEYGKARSSLRQSMQKRGGTDISEAEWYTWGRIAEGLGFRDEARVAYQHLEKPRFTSDVSTYELAQKRLSVLKNAPKP